MFGRIDHQELEQCTQNKTCEFIWRGSDAAGNQTQIFSALTGQYSGGYSPPQGFKWDKTSMDTRITDDHESAEYNVPEIMESFLALALAQANMTRGRNIMWTMGDDFQYQDAESWFSQMDKLIKIVNADGRAEVKYSTPQEYLEAKAKENITLPLREGDFFPYARDTGKYWTGYFTSRPALKRYIRDNSAYYQFAKHVDALVYAGASSDEGLGSDTWGTATPRSIIGDALGILQHHDAITGTSRQHVGQKSNFPNFYKSRCESKTNISD